MSLSPYARALAAGELKPDAAQAAAAAKLESLARALKPEGFSLFRSRKAPRGLYIWGDVGRGKTMLMDLFFAEAPEPKKLRLHFNAFMRDIHARIHALRSQPGMEDPIAPLARAIARDDGRGRRHDPGPAVRAVLRRRHGGGRDQQHPARAPV
jgi:cell division protein ZapE